MRSRDLTPMSPAYLINNPGLVPYPVTLVTQ
jgi:hypothetical protein